MNVEQKHLVPDSNQHQDVHTITTTTIADVLRAEAETVFKLSKALPVEAAQLVSLILATKGKVVLFGIGKSGLVAQKIAATFSSLGIPSFFLHPTEAVHGDLGAVGKDDLCILFSKSGTGAEFEIIAPVLAARSISTVLISCARGILVDKVFLAVVLPFDQEACHFGMAPTSSSTMMMAFGDAIAVAVSTVRQFGKQQFAAHHPAGALGKKLLFTVRSFMLTGQALPLLQPDNLFSEVLVTITAKKQGMVILVDSNGNLQGLITDGDLRRACEQGPSVFAKTAADIATRSPKTIAPETLAFVALEMMQQCNITKLVVTENSRVVGLVHINDLIKAGLAA
jgi:arabinose-5-phosphate isomerase